MPALQLQDLQKESKQQRRGDEDTVSKKAACECTLLLSTLAIYDHSSGVSSICGCRGMCLSLQESSRDVPLRCYGQDICRAPHLSFP